MTKILLMLILINQNLFSQNESKLIIEIDSICGVNSKDVVSDGVIEVKNKRNKIIGSGGFSIQTFLKYSDEETYNKLSNEKKKKYNRKNYAGTTEQT